MTQVQSVASVATATTASKTASAGKANSIDYNAFLQLLVAQLQNQDPTQPMDSTAYMSQLASFSQVEQQVASNAKLESLLAASALQSANLALGHTVTSADGSISGKVSSVEITSDGPLAQLSNGKSLLIGPGVTVS